MRTLADVLGVKDPENKEAPEPTEPPKKLSAKALSRELLNSKQYRASLLRRILADDLPPAVECRLMDYAWGKPIEKVEVDDKRKQLEQMSTQELRERAALLVDLATKIERHDVLIEDDNDEPVHDEELEETDDRTRLIH